MSKKLTLEEAIERAGGTVPVGSDFGIPDDPSVAASAASGTVDALVDAAIVAPQGALLEHADEAIGLFSEDAAESYRGAVKGARERSPYATMGAELGMPDPLMGLGKLGKAGRVFSKGEGLAGSLAQDVATSAAVQHGVSGDVDAWDTGLAAGMGQLLRWVPRALAGDPKDVRASYTGMKRQADILKSKAKGDVSVTEVMDDMMDKLDKDHGFFSGGKSKFNSSTLKFEPVSKAGNLKGKIIPASERELLSRANTAKKDIWNQIKVIEDPKRGEILDHDDLVANGFYEITGQTATTSGKESLAVEKLLETVKDEIFPSGTKKVSLGRLIDQKRKLYERTDYLKEGSNGYLIPVRKKIAKVLNEMIGQTIENPNYSKLNAKYGEFADIETSLKARDLFKGTRDEEILDPSSYGTGAKYGALNWLKDKMLDIRKPFSQMKDTMDKTPMLQEAIQTPVRKSGAMFFSPEEPQRADRRPQSVMTPQERMDMNLPKKLMNATVPRSTEALQGEMGKVFKLKIAQNAVEIVQNRMVEAGIDPTQADPAEVQLAAKDLYKNVSEIIDERPEDIPSVLPMWIKQYPQMFDKDRYNRIDGIVPQSMQPMVREEIRKSQDMGNIDRIKKLDLLNRTGEYQD